MPIIVEDGTGVDNANSYAAIADVTTYLTERNNIEIWEDLDTEEQEAALIKATDYMELMYADRWKGSLSADATTLSWPRVGVYDRKREPVTDAVPLDVKKACMEYAIAALSGDLMPTIAPDDASGKEVKWLKEKVGPIETETEFLPGSRKTVREYAVADRLVRPWITGTSGGVYR